MGKLFKSQSHQFYLVNLSVMKEIVYFCATNKVASGHLLLLVTWHLAIATEELNCNLNLNSNLWRVAAILDSAVQSQVNSSSMKQ